MSDLEARYRDALRWYPKAWRRRNEDAVLGTLLDRADDEKRQTPAAGELANLRGSAILTLLGPLGQIPGPIRERTAALAFSMVGGIAIAALVALALQKSTLPPQFVRLLPATGPFLGVGFIYYGVLILALAAGLIGLKWVARGIAVASIAVAIVLRLSPANRFLDHAPTATTIIFIAALTALSFIGNPFRSARGRTWIAIGAASWAAFLEFTLWYQHATKGGVAGSTDWFLGPLAQWMGFAFPLVIVLAMILWRAKRSPWAGAILIVEVPIILFVFLGWQHGRTLLGIAAFTVAIAATVIGCLLLLRGFGLRIHITRT
jgi:hypothetical protein